MKLINTTNSHADLVKSQLESTDAILVEVYSAGNSDVVFTQAPLHYEILISNMHRAVREQEIEKIREFFLKRKIDANANRNFHSCETVKTKAIALVFYCL